jgi:uncharacterized iron-regulated membrane protein
MALPQTHPLRRWLFRLHLWFGIGIGLLLAAIGVSGSALVFRPEIEDALYVPTVAASDARVSVQSMLTAIKARYPDRRVSRVQFPASTGRAIEFVVSRIGARSLKDAQQIRVFANPHTGELLGTRAQQSSIIFTLQDFHFSLLGGLTGLKVNGGVSVVLLVMSLTGLVLWWPGRAKWRTGFRISTAASWKRITWDLHSVTGFASSLVLLMFAVTGVYYGFREPMTKALLWAVRGVPPVAAPRNALSTASSAASPSVGGSASMSATTPTPASIDTVLARASAAIPAARILALRAPATSTAPWVASASVRNHSGEGDDRIYVDAYTATVLRIDRPSSMPRGARVLEMINPLHLGTFGGLFTRALWVVFGLVPSFLFGTALVMWWNRVVAPWRRRQLSA